MQPLKILMSLHDELDPDAGGGGATTRLAEALRRRGHMVDIHSFARMRGRTKSKHYRYPWVFAAHALRHRDYDILDLSSGDGWVLALALKAMPRLKRPLIITRSHGIEHHLDMARRTEHRLGRMPLSWKYPIYHGGIRLWEVAASLRHADLALFLNDVELRHGVDQLGVEPMRAVRIRNGIADSLVAHAKALARAALPQRPPKPRHVAFVGSYLPMKGVQYLREAMEGIFAEYPDAKLSLLGGKKDAAEIIALYNPAFHDRIRIMPHFANGDLQRLLADVHIIAFPTLAEGFGLALLEAMACGLVPVVSDVGGPTAFVTDDRNGLVVPPRDSAALRGGITALFEDPDRWSMLRQAALATAAASAWDGVAEEAEAIYRKALHDFGRGTGQARPAMRELAFRAPGLNHDSSGQRSRSEAP